MRRSDLTAHAKSMRQNPTPAEQALWFALRGKRFADVKFRRQVVYGDYIADFASRSRMLIVEVDGDTHGHQTDYDARRTRFLEGLGFTVVRFTNAEVLGNLEGVLMAIGQYLPPPHHCD